MNDQELVERLRDSPELFAEVYERHYAAIKKYVLRRVLDYDIASDITSEVFIKALLKIGTFRWKGIPLIAWLYRIAGNEIAIYFSKQQYETMRLNDFAEFNNLPGSMFTDPADEKERWESELRRHKQFLVVHETIRSMPGHYQEAMSLRHFEGKSIKEISEILGKKEGTVKSLLSRGMEQLKKSLQETRDK